MSSEIPSITNRVRILLIVAGLSILTACGGGSSTTTTTTTPTISLSPTSLTFSSQGINTTSTGQVITVSNSGSGAATFSSIMVSGTNSGEFAESNTCGTSLAAGSSCVITVTFTPTTAGSASASLSVADNATGSPQTATLTGTGSSVAVSPASISFSGVTVGTTSSPQTVTVTNSGSSALAISSIALSGTNATNFNLATGANACPNPGNVAAGATCNIYVTFTPTATGTLGGTLTITDNAGGTPGTTQTVSLTGSTSVTNQTSVTVGFGPNGAAGGYYNGIFTTVTVCQPATTTCVSVPNVLVDTGSVGLRILSTALTGVSLSNLNDGEGDTLNECTQYGDGSFNWGPVALATVQIGGEAASQVPAASGGTASSGIPIQLITDDTVPPDVTASGQCVNSSSTPDEYTVATLGSNGILGVGNEMTDCDLAGVNYCYPSIELEEPFYWLCNSSGSCSNSILVPLTDQVWNPVAAFSSSDTDGILVSLPNVGSTGATSVTGTLTFGINSQANNTITSQTTYDLDSDGNFESLTYNGVSYTSSNSGGTFLDSGSNALYVSDPTTLTAATGISTVNCSDNGFYCPSSTLSLPITLTGSNSTSGTATLSIANADSLLNSGSGNAVFYNLGGESGGTGPSTDMWDLGLPFFINRPVFVGIAGTSLSSTGFWAF